MWDVANPDTLKAEYDAFIANPNASTFRVPLESNAFPVYLLSFLFIELALIAYLRFAQRKIRIEIEPETGKARVGNVEFQLGDVLAFEIEDFTRVVARMKQGEPRSLFAVSSATAIDGTRVLESARSRWLSTPGGL